MSAFRTDDRRQPHSIIFFANGTAAVCDDRGEQIGYYQDGWHGTTISLLEADGIDWRKLDVLGTPYENPPGWWTKRYGEPQ